MTESVKPTMRPHTNHQEGDTWRVLDPRRQGREFKVVSFVTLPQGDYAMVEPVGGGKVSRILLARLHESATGKSGYRFMGNASAPIAKAS